MADPHAIDAPSSLTLAQWSELPEDASGEWVDGRLVEEEEVGFLHDLVVAWLIRVLGSWAAERDGVVGASDTRFGVSASRGRKPDVSMYLEGRRPPAHGLVTTPPDVMIEVVSPRPSDARRDRLEKMAEYAAFGVRFYWVVDPALELVEIFELQGDGRYSRAAAAGEGSLDEVPGCPGLTLELDALWREARSLPT